MTAAPIWVEVPEAANLAPGAATATVAGGVEIALFNVGGEFFAVEARCLHKGGNLAEGVVADGVVTCPLHWWRYDVRTGERLETPAIRLPCFPVRLENGRVEVFVRPVHPPVSIRERLLAAGQEWAKRKATH